MSRAAAYFKSIIYLGVFGGLGYMLMKIVEPSEAKLQEYRSRYPQTPAERKRNQAFTDVLRKSAGIDK